MDLIVYEYDQDYVLDCFRNGEFDFVDGVSEVAETEFFRYIGAKKILGKLAETYPTPREKEEVPLWMYVASNLSMRLHGVHSFHAYPYVIRCGGMLNAFGPKVARKTKHPETGDVTLSCNGFNDKNTYDRQTPCDQDYLRKLARATAPEQLHRWFNRDVMQVLKQHRAFDAEGIFLGDASYLFVPDNPNYEGSVRMLFDEHNHPVDSKEIGPEKKARCRWRRCYKMVSLVHTNRAGDYFLYAGLSVIAGNRHEGPILWGLVDGFVEAVGRGVMKQLILDRGFLDGKQIGRCKQEHGIDVLIPLKKNMDVYEDVLGLVRARKVKFEPYSPPPPKPPVNPKPTRVPREIQQREKKRQKTLQQRKESAPPPPADKVLIRSEIASIRDFRTWPSCPVPLNVTVNQEHYADGHTDTWMLVDTGNSGKGACARDDYRLRTGIEERHRQLKCFVDLMEFTSRKFSLICNQVVFVALCYSLMQLFLLRIKRADLNRRTEPQIRRQLMPTDSFIIVYYCNRFALFTTAEYTEILLTLSAEASKKILEKIRRLRRELTQELKLVRAP
ncbi:MAG: transposase [Acidobacteria bacterium]|nr:transposase [Acidobacteriota bacterium]